MAVKPIHPLMLVRQLRDSFLGNGPPASTAQTVEELRVQLLLAEIQRKVAERACVRAYQQLQNKVEEAEQLRSKLAHELEAAASSAVGTNPEMEEEIQSTCLTAALQAAPTSTLRQTPQSGQRSWNVFDNELLDNDAWPASGQAGVPGTPVHATPEDLESPARQLEALAASLFSASTGFLSVVSGRSSLDQLQSLEPGSLHWSAPESSSSSTEQMTRLSSMASAEAASLDSSLSSRPAAEEHDQQASSDRAAGSTAPAPGVVAYDEAWGELVEGADASAAAALTATWEEHALQLHTVVPPQTPHESCATAPCSLSSATASDCSSSSNSSCSCSSSGEAGSEGNTGNWYGRAGLPYFKAVQSAVQSLWKSHVNTPQRSTSLCSLDQTPMQDPLPALHGSLSYVSSLSLPTPAAAGCYQDCQHVPCQGVGCHCASCRVTVAACVATATEAASVMPAASSAKQKQLPVLAGSSADILVDLASPMVPAPAPPGTPEALTPVPPSAHVQQRGTAVGHR
mmetsp:Transcript_15918/g.34373  ORF Transcript_15918/g.34373 Transcript_15918/m.34373 type:complete len:513 (+) Transcript_15918:174-1712(+)|eukprot:CAMPEP_0202897982 /NCGR_PEP_ID=MMETSP1392-20130828/6598_1 /ASSEMBLY_ACC=CAM_ASM_000868 /TAXON_ID=225041 /ORGANISM="Chlamydomonas chlamydogama, Strain SAG 11-48b" /LENGTH=512 /DNA_ID=CAMNT_0049583763 /DNA_START=125 /DNA_END=1663 /DNA_ORIENTATION=-